MTDEFEPKAVYFHGERRDVDTIRGLATYETLAAFIKFQHEIRRRALEITQAKDVRPSFMVDDETKPDMLSLYIFVHYHEESPYKNRYWSWLDIEVNDLVDYEGFIGFIVEKIANEYKLFLKDTDTAKDESPTHSGDQHQHS